MNSTTRTLTGTPGDPAGLDTRGRLAVRIIAGSLALGVAGDALLRAGPWGLNFVLWLSALLVFTRWLARGHGQAVNRHAALLGLGAWVFAVGLAGRNSPALALLNVLCAGILLALGLARARGERVFSGGVTEHLWRIAGAVGEAVAGYVPLFLGQTWWTPQATAGWSANVRAATIGVLLATPLLIAFGGLLASADIVFRDLLGRIFDFDLPDLVSHLIPIGVGAWLVAGWLGALVFRRRTDKRPATLPQFVTLGPIEICVALGLVNALFLGFLIIQSRYLFGGAELVHITPDLTYAEYARRGFFELVAVVAIALPMLLSADWLLAENSRRGFRWQAAIMVALLGIILGSAWYRLRLYQAEYGWTELRFFVTAFMLWLAAVLAWFAVSVLSGRRHRFTGGALLAALATGATLNAWNPAAWIARQNLAHARAGHAFDAHYALRLGDDAVPVLLPALNSLPPGDRELLMAGWAARMPLKADWRTWNWARTEARQRLLAAGIEPDTERGLSPLDLE